MRKRKWLRWILTLTIALFVVSAGLSRALRTRPARRYLTAHLEASFGRPVEVGRFDFSLLDGARLEAHSVTVSEDSRFGHEYFLRAETLTAGLRWPALLSGRFEFGTLSFSKPSLNLVRDAQGRWNIERWLPPVSPGTSVPGSVGLPAAPRGVSTARLYRIDVDDGRINFKQGDDKSPFALLDVSGRLEQDSAGRWELDLEARPMRAGVELQEIGMLRLRGNIAGTSARLQPAELSLTWRGVSLADALRLSSQFDYGVRGQLAVDLSARVAPPDPPSNDAAGPRGAQWSISGVARLTGIHGWKLPAHATDPAVNLSLEAAWRLGGVRAEIGKLLVEMPSSRMQGSGDLDWGHGFHPQLHIESSSLGLGDLLAWYRAFRPGIAETLGLEGTLGVDATLSGWPLQLEQGALASVGGKLTASSLPSPLHIGAINASVSRGALDFAPTEISFPAAASQGTTGTISAVDASPNTFVMGGTIFPDRPGALRWPPNWSFSIEGATSRIEDWLALSQALAQPLTSGWTAAGGLATNMRGVHRAGSPATLWLGTVDFRGLTATPPFVNQPLRFPRAHVELAPSQRTITLFAAEAFGATWRGTVGRMDAGGHWTFDLSADHLDASELDRWMGPRARPGLLARLRGLGKPAADTPERDAAIARMAARGRLRVAEIVLAPLRLERFDGEAVLAGRTITIRKAQADFFGGQVAGGFDAQLLADPSYRFQGSFDRVDLARLGHAVPSLNNRISGTASATVTLAAHGVGRENLVRSMEGDGAIYARNAELRGLDLASLIPGGNPDSPPGRFVSAKGSFHIGSGGIETSDFVLDNSQGRFQAEGRIDFSRTLNFRIHPSMFHATTSPANASPPSFLLSGTVEAPKLVLSSPAPKAAAKSGFRGR